MHYGACNGERTPLISATISHDHCDFTTLSHQSPIGSPREGHKINGENTFTPRVLSEKASMAKQPEGPGSENSRGKGKH